MSCLSTHSSCWRYSSLYLLGGVLVYIDVLSFSSLFLLEGLSLTATAYQVVVTHVQLMILLLHNECPVSCILWLLRRIQNNNKEHEVMYQYYVSFASVAAIKDNNVCISSIRFVSSSNCCS